MNAEALKQKREKKNAAMRKLRAERKMKGLCRECGVTASFGLFCATHREKNKKGCKRYYIKNRDKAIANYARRYLDLVMKGLCVVCGSPVLSGVCCVECNKKRTHRRDEYRKSGRCTRCGRVLDEEIDGDNVTCNICIEEAVFRNRVNGGVAL